MPQHSSPSVGQLLADYENLASKWDQETVSRKANKLFDRLHAIALQLRVDDQGRAGLENLLQHESRGVRLTAASDCLAWGSPAAETALEKLVETPGTHSLNAEMTLREYRAGRMKFDW